MRALTRTIGYVGHPGDLWHQARAATAPLSWSVPMPAIEPHRRPSACVLAIASRLAPLAPDEPNRQLRAFLADLPAEMLNATARLAARTLPPVETDSVGSPADGITARLRILQLVGTHRTSSP
jgi:hypothetical protein